MMAAPTDKAMKMSKCNAFGRDAHQTKIHHLQPGDLVSPRRVVKAWPGEQVVTPRRVEDAIAAANVAIERREVREDAWAQFVRWIKG